MATLRFILPRHIEERWKELHVPPEHRNLPIVQITSVKGHELIAHAGICRRGKLNLKARIIRTDGLNHIDSTGQKILDRYGCAHLTSYRSTDREDIVIGKYFIKWGVEKERNMALFKEAFWYDHALKRLQGEVVPVFYGFFCDNLRSPTIACSIFELLTPDKHYMLKDCDSSIRETMLSVCRVHESGIIHNALKTARQKIEHIFHTTDGVRIVGFSQADRHECLGARPQRTQAGRLNKRNVFIDMTNAAMQAGFYVDTTPFFAGYLPCDPDFFGKTERDSESGEGRDKGDDDTPEGVGVDECEELAHLENFAHVYARIFGNPTTD